MANTDIVQKIAAAQFQRAYYQNNIWRALIDDRSAELPDHGNTLNIPTDSTAYVVNNRTNMGLDVTDSDNFKVTKPIVVSANGVDLVVNQTKDISVLVAQLVELQTRPSFLTSATEKSGRVARETVNNFLRTTYNGIQADAATGTRRVSAAIAVTTANWGKEAHQNALDEAIRDATVKADEEHWPREGRVCVSSPAVMDVVREEIISKNPPLQSSPALDDALINARAVVYRDWVFVMDDSMGPVNASMDADQTLYFMLRGQGLSFAERLNQLRVIADPAEYHGTLLKGILFYGAAITDKSKLLIQKHAIT